MRGTSKLRVVFAIALCALAILFAVEAKVSGYSSASVEASAVHAAKAWPSETARVVAARPAPANEFPFQWLVSVLLAVLPLTHVLFVRLRIASSPAPDSVTHGAAVSLYRRPPPAL